MKSLLSILFLLNALSPLLAQTFSDQDNVESLSNKSIYSDGEYRMGLFHSLIIDTNKTTHIIVVGSAVKNDSDQFFQTGIARAQRYNELWPEHQVIIMSSPEVRGASDAEIFSRFSIPVIKQINGRFSQTLLISELLIFKSIASIDFIGHSSPWAFKLGKTNAAFAPDEIRDELSKLRANLEPNAYITISSCNSGFNIAPALSEILEIPVAGALTSSLFEGLQSNEMWYKERDFISQRPPFNTISYLSTFDCDLGLCWRMKPDRNNYSAYWGAFKEGGLSFYKFFCNFENDNGSCEEAMATSLLSFPSVVALSERPDREDFEKVVFDWLCSTGPNSKYFTNCVEGIKSAVERGDLVYQQMTGNELECDFKTCNATVVCKKAFWGSGPRAGSCHLNTKVNSQPTTLAREYLSLMRGFDSL